MQLYLKNWCAWTPSVTTGKNKSEWSSWLQAPIYGVIAPKSPDVDFLPAMFRRRLTPIHRMALHVVYHCLQEVGCLNDDILNVFASRHGDLHNSLALMNEYTHSTPISPFKFSHSVHNTAAGLASIAFNNKAPSYSVSAGRNTLQESLRTVWSLLETNSAQDILWVYYDQAVPELFAWELEAPNATFAVAVLFSRSKTLQRIALSELHDHANDQFPIFMQSLLNSCNEDERYFDDIKGEQ